VPDLLRSGHHARIEAWRRHEALRRTMRERPDLLAEAALDDDERALLDRWSGEGADHERD
jgi:tRNA (guanine37-N1)-methyltransferase